MEWHYVHTDETAWKAAGTALLERDERCRQAMTCTRCELTDGKSKIRHDWNSGEEVREADSGEIKRLYKCWQCGCEDLRGRMQTARY